MPCSTIPKLHCHYAFDVGVWIVVFEGEIFKMEVENALHVGVEAHGGQWSRVAAELFAHLLEVVGVDVCIAECVNELAGFKSCHLSHHHKQQGVGSNIEGYTEENVGTALVELERQPAVGHIELEQRVAWRQIHHRQVGNVPRTHYYAARVGIMLDCFHGFGNLVDKATVVVGP